MFLYVNHTDTICVPAAALYYLAELIEEYTVLAAKFITYMIGVSAQLVKPDTQRLSS